MFNITGGEIVIVLILALVVLGPDKLPEFVRRAGRLYGEVKRMSTGFRTEFRDAIDEPAREMRETMNVARSWFDEGIAEVKDVASDVRSAADFTEPEFSDADDDPNFYDDDGRLITSMPPLSAASGTGHQTSDDSESGEPAEAHTAEAPGGGSTDRPGPGYVDGAVDPFGGLTARPNADGPPT